MRLVFCCCLYVFSLYLCHSFSTFSFALCFMARLNPLSLYSCSHFVSHFIYSICSLCFVLLVFPPHMLTMRTLSLSLVFLLCAHAFTDLLFVHFIIIMLLAFSRFYFIHLQTYKYSRCIVSYGTELKFILRVHAHIDNIDETEVS